MGPQGRSNSREPRTGIDPCGTAGVGATGRLLDVAQRDAFVERRDDEGSCYRAALTRRSRGLRSKRSGEIAAAAKAR
jgi:hypothetical protein